MEYPFYIKKGEDRKTGRIYPFCHKYGANIALQMEPFKRVYRSFAPSSLEGVHEKDLTLMNVFGTDTPNLRFRSLLVLKTDEDRDLASQDILGYRFMSDSSFPVDVDADVLEPEFKDLVFAKVGRGYFEYLVNCNGAYFSDYELDLGLKVLSVGESNEVMVVIKNYLRGVLK